MNALAARRRHPAAIALLLLLGLIITGSAYAAFAPRPAEASIASSDQLTEGKQIFQANCASCHGLNAEGRATGVGDHMAGPALAGVGAASVDFQMGTGRMPMRAPGAQAPATPDQVKFSQAQIDAVGAWVAALAPGPAVPSDEAVDPAKGDVALGGTIFRTNCAMCHNFAGSGGALTRGKYAPSLRGVSPTHMYEAMETGPQSMPVFGDNNLSPQDKRDVIAFLTEIDNAPAAGGIDLGALGPVSEGFFIWTFGLGIVIACAVWIGSKAA